MWPILNINMLRNVARIVGNLGFVLCNESESGLVGTDSGREAVPDFCEYVKELANIAKVVEILEQKDKLC
jgi:hypothetical protein